MQPFVFSNFWAHWAIFTVAVLFGVLMLIVALLWFDRRFWSRFQIRVGPNRCGPWGLLQIPADGLKMVLKEDIMPDNADKVLHVMAPVIIMFPVMVAFAVMPFAASARGGLAPNLNIGLIYLVAITSLVGIGMLAAGWGSGNKYSLMSGMRIVATMVSYEFPVVLALIGVALMAGSLSLNDVVGMQQEKMWFVLMQPLGFLIFFIGMLAEASRSPFDYAEGESETICGVNTEYSGLRFGVFQLTEWMEGILMSCLVATLFLGGYSFLGPVWTYPDGPLGVFIGLVVFLLKATMVYLVLGWIKCTMPGRLRIDQWMGFAWKGLLPLAVLNLFIIAVEVVGFGRGEELPLWVIVINILACIVLILMWSRLWKTGGGRVNVRAVR